MVFFPSIIYLSIISFKLPPLLGNLILTVPFQMLHWDPQMDRASERTINLKEPRVEWNTVMGLMSY